MQRGECEIGVREVRDVIQHCNISLYVLMCSLYRKVDYINVTGWFGQREGEGGERG